MTDNDKTKAVIGYHLRDSRFEASVVEIQTPKIAIVMYMYISDLTCDIDEVFMNNALDRMPCQLMICALAGLIL